MVAALADRSGVSDQGIRAVQRQVAEGGARLRAADGRLHGAV